MSFDLQYVQYLDVIPTRRVGLIPGFYPAVFDIYGQDFRNVSTVLLNDVPAKDFLVLSSTRLVAQLGDDIADSELTGIKVLSTAFTATEASELSFQFARASRLVSGLPKLVQTFVKLLLTTPGSDIYDREAGGDLMSLQNRSGSKGDKTRHTGAFAAAVSRTQEQLVVSQSLNPSLPLSERLMTAQLVTVNFDPNTLTVTGVIRLISMAGKEALASLAADSKEAA